MVAVQDSFSLEAAHLLVPQLLAELRRDGRVDRALAIARQRLAGRDDWWQPALTAHITRLWMAPDGTDLDLRPLPQCPYPGMVPFSREDDRYFFGREAEIAEICARLKAHRRLFVIGPSGSGKSSLLAAGVLRELHDRQPGLWDARTMRPGPTPTSALAAALGLTEPPPPDAWAKRIEALLAPAQSRRKQGARRLLLVVDQAEELFAQAVPEEQAAFIAALKACTAFARCTVVCLLRADFYGELMNSALWPESPEERFDLRPLGKEGLREAINSPARAVEVYLEPALVDQLVADAADEPGALPLVQETLTLLWERAPGRRLTRGLYHTPDGGQNGLTAAIAEKAETVLRQIEAEVPDGQATACGILLRLIQFGQGRADTRRQQPVSALRSTAANPDTFRPVLDLLASNRLLILGGEPGAETPAVGKPGAEARVQVEPTVDIAHEALITSWPRLQRWSRELREVELGRRELAAKAAVWQAHGGHEQGLLSRDDLAKGQLWLKQASRLGGDYGAIAGLVAASARAIQRTQRQIRQLIFAVVGLVIVTLLSSTFFLVRENEQSQRAAATAEALAREAREARATAVVDRDRAEARERSARAGELAALAQAAAVNEPERGLLLALEAVNTAGEGESPSFLAEQALRETLAQLQGEIILRPPVGEVEQRALSPNGHYAALVISGTLQLWDLSGDTAVPIMLGRGTTGDALPPKDGGTPSKGLWFSPDGRRLVWATTPAELRIWDLERPEQEPLRANLAGPVVGLVFDPSRPRFVTVAAATDATVVLWEIGPSGLASTALPHDLTLDEDGRLWVVISMSSDGRLLAIGRDREPVRLWDLGQPLAAPRLLSGDVDLVMDLLFSLDGRYLFGSVGEGYMLFTWDLSAGPAPIVEQLMGRESDGSSRFVGSVLGARDLVLKLPDGGEQPYGSCCSGPSQLCRR